MVALTPEFIHSIQSAVFGVLGEGVRLIMVFGSYATGKARPDSDLDIALDAGTFISPEQHIALIGALASITGCPIDLVDLRRVGEPLLGQILQHGKRVYGADEVYAKYLTQHMIDMADFVPLQNRILEERMRAWIGR